MITARDTSPDLTTKLNASFGELLATSRKRKGVSQTQLAERSGYSRATVANIEAGKQNVLLAQLFSLARALNEEPSSLLPRQHEPHSGHGSQADVFVHLAKKRLNLILNSAAAAEVSK